MPDEGDIKGLKEQLAELAEAMEDSDTGDSIPYARFQKLNAKLRDLKSQMTRFEGALSEKDTKIAELTGTLKDTEKNLTKLTQERDTLVGEKTTWTLEREIVKTGITDEEGLRVAMTLWKAVPEDQRPEGGFDAWVKAEEGGAPKAVRAYLPSEGQQGQGQAPKQPTVPTALQYDHAPAGQPIPADVAAYKAQRDALWGGQAPTYPWQKKD